MASSSRSLIVKTNTFEITRLPTKQYYQYAAIQPDVKGPRHEHNIIARMQVQNPHVFNPQAIYDGKAILFSPHQLSIGAAGTFDVSMSNIPGSSRGKFQVKLTLVHATINPWVHLNNLITRGEESPHALVAINLLQLIIRAQPNLLHPHNARAYFPDVENRIGGGLEIRSGFFSNVRASQGKMIVNNDLSTTVLYRRGPLPDVALELLDVRDSRRLRCAEGSTEFRKLTKALKGLRVTVVTDRNRENPRQKTIMGLVPSAGRHRFTMKDGAELTVQEYYMKAYSRSLSDPDMFGIIINNDAVIPAELCYVVPGQFYKKKVPDTLMKAVLKFSTRKPVQRLAMILNDANSPARYSDSRFLADANMAISPNPLEVPGRVLEPPSIQFHRGEQPLRASGGKWNLVGSKFFAPVKLQCWVVVNYAVDAKDDEVGRFLNLLVRCCRDRGINIEMPPGDQVCRGDGSNPRDALRRVGNVAFNRWKCPPEMALVILPTSAAPIRKAVKQFGDIEMGIATQCIRRDKLPNVNNQYCNNVALKINARLGGQNSIPASPIMDYVGTEPFMVLGADVSHPGPGVTTQPSIASLVWSYDPKACKYIAFSTVQKPRQEIIQELGEMVKAALLRFSSLNSGFLPRRIFFYRDGVSEGEYAQVSAIEIASIQTAIDAAWATAKSKPNTKPSPAPKVSFVVVGKRHHIRFFPRNPQEGDSTGNCPAGLLVDQGISSPIAFDFYLQSHGAILGTSRPSHYIVLKDDNFPNQKNGIPELSFALCHVYARATRSVSIPAPVYYADIVCARGMDFYFRDEFAMRYGDDATTASGGSEEFDLREWQREFGGTKIKASQSEKMFFV